MAENSDSLRPWALATVWGVTGMSFTAVALRLLSRWEKKAPLKADDYLIIFSQAWNFLVVGFIMGMNKYGMGLHADTLPPEHVVKVAQFLVVAEVLYVWNLVWSKLSLLSLYYRIFDLPSFKIWAYVIGAFIIAWVITITFVFIFICVPVEKLWYPQTPGYCINQVGTWIANAVSTILTDLAILILPLPQVWKLQLSTFQKISITVAFALGFFVVFASIYRLTVLFSYSALDSTYTLAPVVGWTAIEMSAGITSACLPTLRPALHYILRTIGIKQGISSLVNTTRRGTNNISLTDGSASKLRSNSALDSGLSHHGRVENTAVGAFHRLRDNGSNDTKLRPDHGFVHTVTSMPGSKDGNISSSKGDADSQSGDEVPLHSIRVHRDFKSVESSRV